MGSGQSPSSYPGQMGHPAVQQPSSPVFVSPPAKSQRLLHSEAYLRYIEGLTAESATISKWDQTLSGSFGWWCLHASMITAAKISDVIR